MPLYGPKAGTFREKQMPTTKAQYRETIISYMIGSGEAAQRIRDREERLPKHNPDCLPEMSITQKFQPKRLWTVAQEMVTEGVAVIVRGSFESGEVYIVAGPKWEER